MVSFLEILWHDLLVLDNDVGVVVGLYGDEVLLLLLGREVLGCTRRIIKIYPAQTNKI